MPTKKQSLFFKATSPKLSAAISIKSPYAFKKSIKRLEKHGLSKKEKSALVLAQNRARAQLKRKTLSQKERNQFRKISNMPLPNVNTRT